MERMVKRYRERSRRGGGGGGGGRLDFFFFFFFFFGGGGGEVWGSVCRPRIYPETIFLKAKCDLLATNFLPP